MPIKQEYTEEYVEINGIKQYFLHYEASHNIEVMLILHGGPGQSEASFAYYTETQMTDFTSVYYDQRGAGKTLRKNPTDGSDITQAQLMADLVETVEYIKKKYNKEKIILSGHSWGSVLGLLYAKAHPENLLFYIGACQIINFMRGEKENFDKLKELAKDYGKDCIALETLGDYPNNIDSIKKWKHSMKTILKIKKKYGMWVDSKKAQKIAMKSPVFTMLDILPMIKAQKLINHLFEFLMCFSAEDITDFRVPMYFIHGDRDYQIPVSLVEEYIESINAPDKKLYIVPNAGHIINIDNPDGVISISKSIFGRFKQRMDNQ